jgi:hypothetical protein
MEHLAPRGAIGQWSRGWGRSEQELTWCVFGRESLVPRVNVCTFGTMNLAK